MPSKREQVIDRLFHKLKTLESPNLSVYRNQEKSQRIPADGLIVLRDGISDEPEIMLSPVLYVYQHMVSVEVMVQHHDAAWRHSTIDALLVAIGSVINAHRTLDGLAEWVEARTPEFQDEPIEGAASIRAATLLIMVRFFTTAPLN